MQTFHISVAVVYLLITYFSSLLSGEKRREKKNVTDSETTLKFMCAVLQDCK